MNPLPVYMSASSSGPSPADSSPQRSDNNEGASAFHPLSYPNNAYYANPSSFHPSPSGYLEERKDAGYQLTAMTNSMLVSSVVDSVAGSSNMGPQIHHHSLETPVQETEAPELSQFMDTYFVDSASSNGRHVMEEVIIGGNVDGHQDDDERRNPMALNKDLHREYNLEEFRRIRHAENSRLRYHRLTPDKRREVNQRRAERIKKQRQRDKEINELEEILRSSNDIQDEPLVQEQLRLRQHRRRRAEAARNRYHRMSEDERRSYNQRRRLKAMGLDPDGPRKTAPEEVRERIKRINEKKAATARARYHAMSEDERRQYNARRTAAFRRRRVEEEILLSTPAGSISAQALERAQQIMMRNAKKAESARLRYQRMTPEERKDYNQRRAAAKKHSHPFDGTLNSSNVSLSSHDISMSDAGLSPGGGDSILLDPVTLDPMVGHGPVPDLGMGHASSTLMDSSQLASTSKASVSTFETHNNDSLRQFEKEIEERTKQAQAQLMRVRMNPNPYATEEPIVVLVTTENVVDPQGKETIYLQPASTMINEKQLQEMLTTGRDENGRPVEIRTVEGQTLTPAVRDEPPIIEQLNVNSSKVYGQIEQSEYGIVEQQGRVGDVNHLPNVHTHRFRPDEPMSVVYKQEIAKQKRAAKARERYRNMNPEERAEFNAKRAETLRKARRRDDELVHLGEQTPFNQLDDETKRAVLAAQARRARRAEQARQKYHRMNSEERRQYNAMRDAQRRQRKRELDQAQMERRLTKDHENEDRDESPGTSQQGDASQILYSTYEIYPDQGNF